VLKVVYDPLTDKPTLFVAVVLVGLIAFSQISQYTAAGVLVVFAIIRGAIIFRRHIRNAL
jgi:hypothetical protein